MLEKWEKYQAKEVLSGKDEFGNRLISLFAKDYKQITGSDICPACRNFKEKYNNFIKKLEQMEKAGTKNSGFSLKPIYNNITLHGSNKYFNNDNLTDESALELLEKHPKGKGLFATIPENYQEVVKSKAKTDGALVLFEKELSIEQAKNLFKAAGIETKAGSVKGFEDKFEKLSVEQKAALEALINTDEVDEIEVDETLEETEE